mmetsp:Transcript_117212/g.311769  ORF Transcript_117212/g.311769 Transcript_117212/m.311769 type:complete len:241 (-) Transcript_117212:541-1263(-)
MEEALHARLAPRAAVAVRDVPRAAPVGALLAWGQVAPRVPAPEGGIHRCVGSSCRRRRPSFRTPVAAVAQAVEVLQVGLRLDTALLQLDQGLLASNLEARVLVWVDEQRDASVRLADVVAVRALLRDPKKLERPLPRDGEDALDDPHNPLRGDPCGGRLRRTLSGFLCWMTAILADYPPLLRSDLWTDNGVLGSWCLVIILVSHSRLVENQLGCNISRPDLCADGLEKNSLEDLELLPGV